MAKIIELSIAENYVPAWGILEAVRELYQNCLDQETVNPENSRGFDYDPDEQILKISNKLSTLDRSSLVLGMSTKANDARTIGKFGEGYKLALLVLTRLGHDVKILNYALKEEWIPQIKMSKGYSTRVLAVHIRKFVFRSVPDHNLTFVISGITPETYADIVETNLHLQNLNPDRVIEHGKSRVLLDADQIGRIYVNGLFVSKTKLSYGYDMSPSVISLDRDRSMVRDFDLHWQTSQMWSGLVEDHSDKIFEMIDKESEDVKYLENVSSDPGIKDKAYIRFREEHGENAEPVESQDDYDSLKKAGRTPVFVSGIYGGLIRSSPMYSRWIPSFASRPTTPEEILQGFKDNYGDLFTAGAEERFDEIIEESRKWSKD